ncbi:ribosomal protein S12 methylthiotransferase accessory factor [Streptomyces sp. 1114.5]|uniref:TOMM precursor leader peptide-binding protein n=1 Tax=Streptomyces sp. 1114.5 TaxID=1938830 RepID=UPI000EAD6A15|nr:TOMM precursor leader peptide-binding protein [Streptomyces sp. 1114.5]RKT20126.1 ribosomal protein S12 methylthiotransferase accessory factor [Streptomyces sp. 1114.5]
MSALPVLTPDQALATTTGTAVVHLTEWTLGLAARLSRHALAHPVRLVPVREDGALTLVGPVLHPGTPACLACTEYQRLATAGGRVPWQSPELALAGTGTPAFEEAVAALAAELAEAATDSAAAEPVPAPSGAVVHVVNGARATWSTHRVRPVGGCPVCHPLPADTPEAARLPATPRPLPDPAVLRGPNDRTEAAQLRAELYDERFGPVRRLFRTEDSAFALTSAWVTDGRALDDGGYGRAADFRSSERVALFEAVERFAGMRPLGRRTVLRASYAALERASGPGAVLDPARLGLPDPAHHGHPAAATVPYTPDLELDWVHGWSLTHRRPVAVPEHVAYWDVPDRDHPRVVYESSNGCGLGNSPQEAALYGLFEVAERDAFLMAWYARTPLPGLTVPTEDPQVAELAERARLFGYRLTLLDATNDLGIPAVIALCRHRGGHPDAPRTLLAAGAHHDPLTAIRSAVAEVVTNVQEAPHRSTAPGGPRDPQRLRPMLEQPDLVVSLEDHVGLNALPEAQGRLDFLFAGPPPVPWQQRLPGTPAPVTDLTELLEHTVARLAGEGLEVLVVTQDEPGVRDRLGLHCAKVVVPGTLPMTFGHVNRRTRGLPRLLEVPHRLGRTRQPLRHDELPLHPHPFP